MTRIAEITPVFCTACHGQYPERRHIDFDAAYDGPIMQVDGSVPYPIEDLILCEDCVTSAAEALGLDAETDELNELRLANRQLMAHVRKLQSALTATADALEHRPAVVENALRPKRVRKEPVAA